MTLIQSILAILITLAFAGLLFGIGELSQYGAVGTFSAFILGFVACYLLSLFTTDQGTRRSSSLDNRNA